jgi:hypothetical protein
MLLDAGCFSLFVLTQVYCGQSHVTVNYHTPIYYSHSSCGSVFNNIYAYFHFYKNTLIKHQNIRIAALQNAAPWVHDLTWFPHRVFT